jgi:hypothetical protein
MPLDLDRIALSSTTAALRNSASGEFTVTLSGTLGAGVTTSYSGSASLSRSTSLVRLYVKQSTVPAGTADYTSNDLLPCPPYGAYGYSPQMWVGCSVAGSPSVTEIDVYFKVQFTPTAVTVTAYINNFAPGTMTLTSTTLTFRYVCFLPTQ